MKDATELPQDRERLFMVAASRHHFTYNPFEPPMTTAERRLPLQRIVDRSTRADAAAYLRPDNRYYRMIEREMSQGESLDNIYQLRRSYVREKRDGLCPTLTANMGIGGHNVPFVRDEWGIRRLSVREVGMLQGFDDVNFPPDMPETEQYRLLGTRCASDSRGWWVRRARLPWESRTVSSVSEIGWHFPPTWGGVAMGYNDPGIAHFGGAREQSLARETIQNSLDAAASLGKPVDVTFELRVHDDDWFAKSKLAATIQRCLTEAKDRQDEKASRAFEEAAQLLGNQRLTFLRVADRNTTGLRGEKWDALLKRPGVSVHDQPGAGGSWGIGKNAPFTLSPLRTVFYWTRFEENGEPTERFQGKAVLMAHESDGQERQSTGFFGLVDRCRAVDGNTIPSAVRDVERSDPGRLGTSLWIAGFREQDAWQERIARRVAASFFDAIQDGNLTVTIEPSDGMKRHDLIDIEAENLGKWFDYLEQNSDAEWDDEDDDIDDARHFWELLQGEPTAERQDYDLGHCRLWITVSDDAALPSKVGLMRKTGMLITTRQLGLMRFRGMRDFIAICRFEGDAGNELLRKMENPRHDQFEPERIENDPKEQQRGRAALRRHHGVDPRGDSQGRCTRCHHGGGAAVGTGPAAPGHRTRRTLR